MIFQAIFLYLAQSETQIQDTQYHIGPTTAKLCLILPTQSNRAVTLLGHIMLSSRGRIKEARVNMHL